MFSGKTKQPWRRCWGVSTILGHSNVRAFFLCLPIALILSHINHVPLILQRNALGWLVDALSFKHWDLGSIPRSPIFPYIFFVTCSGGHHSQRFTICLRQLVCHMSSNANPRAIMGGLPYALVNRSTRIPEKSTKGMNSLGQIKDHTSIIGAEPPFLFVFLSPFFFSFFCFNLFVLI